MTLGAADPPAADRPGEGAPVRPSRHAGTWYPGEPDALRRLILDALPRDVDQAPARALIVPHAGYRYSLSIAAQAFARTSIPAVALVLCPNHTVPPPIVSVWPGGAWETPLGRVPLEEDLVRLLRAECPDVLAETGAHRREQGVELQLPILQMLRADVRLVPVVVAEPSPRALRALGEGIARTIRAWGDPDDVLLVASTDMTHFAPADVARRQDERALERVLALDPEGLLERCAAEGITMCGVRPTAVALAGALALGATRAEVVGYGSSGDVTGDRTRVVGYAAAVVR